MKIQGVCPMGCGETLFLGAGGYPTCSWLHCPRPDAATVVLEGAYVECSYKGELMLAPKPVADETLRMQAENLDLREQMRKLRGLPQPITVDRVFKVPR